MIKKNDLLKELGWDDQLIQHFMIENSEFDETDEKTKLVDVSDSCSMTLTLNAENAGTNFIIKRQG